MIPVERPHLIVAAATHPGRKGKLNEDRYSVTAYRLSPDNAVPAVLALLADGIGGHRGGEVAADLAVQTITSFVQQSAAEQPAQILKGALAYANQAILKRASEDSSLAGMGTTCVCAWVIGEKLYATSVGDSRLYLYRGAELARLTTDHTWIEEALSRGTLTPELVKGHPNAHIIRRFLGSMNKVNPDMRLRLDRAESDSQAEANQGLLLHPGDRLLLCTDGLTDLVKDTEILDILRKGQLEACLTHLIDLANQRGGHDNITVVTMEVPDPPEITRPLWSPKKNKNVYTTRMPRTKTSWWMLILLLIAIIMMILLLVYTYLY